jgi:hypothetical protein
MTTLYNQYIRPISPKDEYNAKIAFVQTPKGIISKKIFYVKFVDESKDGFYYDSNKYLVNLLGRKAVMSKNGSLFDEAKFLEISNNRITDVTPSINYFSYIKVIEDKRNPQLEDKIFILKFGYKINSIIRNQNGTYKKVFHISMKLTHGYPNYDLSCFTNEDINIVDNTLDLESEIFYKTINMIAVERKEKLQKIKDLNDEIEEWICE